MYRRGRSSSQQAKRLANGYKIHLELPLSFTQGSLSLSINDIDNDQPNAQQTLWLIGQPENSLIGDHSQIKPFRFEVP